MVSTERWYATVRRFGSLRRMNVNLLQFALHRQERNRRLHKPPLADGVQITVNVNNLHITVDPHLIRRVSANLILNAMQAVPHGRTLALTATSANGSVAINISDTDIGVPADMRDKIFSPSLRAKQRTRDWDWLSLSRS